MKSLQAGTATRQAREYAKRGWFTFPLKRSAKEPMDGSRGFKDAVADERGITRLFTIQHQAGLANIAIATGPSHLAVVDVDSGQGKSGQESWDSLIEQHGHVDTYTVRTWSGGLHFYYSDPDGEVPASAGKLGKNIDTRGNTGYVVAPPSRVEVDGRVGDYEVVNDVPLAPVPRWIVEALKKPEMTYETSGEIAATDEVLARVKEHAADIAAIPFGEHGEDVVNQRSFWVGQYVGAGQIDEFEAIQIMLGSIADWSWANPGDQKKFRQKIVRSIGEGKLKPKAWEASTQGADLFDPFAEESEPDEEKRAERISAWATDAGQGTSLRDQIGGIRYAVGVGWLLWDGKRWETVPVEFVQQKIAKFYRKQFERAVTKYKSTVDDDDLKIATTFKAFMSTNRMGSILAAFKVTDGVLTRAEALDSHEHLLNTQSGVVDLRTGEQSKHDPKLLMTKITKASFEAGYKHEDWEMALKALPVDVADWMQLRFGQALTGSMPISDDFVFLHGGGSNGKSAWTGDGILHAVGDYGILASPNLLTKTDGGASPERASLRGARFVLMEELPEGKSLSMAEVKRVIGTATITARNLYEKEVTFDASHSLFVATNFMPPIAETDEGTWRRMCKVVFPYEFVVGKPKADNERQGDPGLKPRLKHGNDGQHEAMLAWMVAGAVRYYKDPAAIMPANRPASVVHETTEWRKTADRILAFLDERMVFDPDAVVLKQEAFDEFSAYLETHGHAKWAMTQFIARLSAHKTFTNGKCRMDRVRTATTPLERRVVMSEYGGMQVMKPVPAQAYVIRGLRFRTAADDV